VRSCDHLYADLDVRSGVTPDCCGAFELRDPSHGKQGKVYRTTKIMPKVKKRAREKTKPKLIVVTLSAKTKMTRGQLHRAERYVGTMLRDVVHGAGNIGVHLRSLAVESVMPDPARLLYL